MMVRVESLSHPGEGILEPAGLFTKLSKGLKPRRRRMRRLCRHGLPQRGTFGTATLRRLRRLATTCQKERG